MTSKRDWWEHPACMGEDPSTWVWAKPPSQATVDSRLSTCSTCPVIRECHEETALTFGRHPHAYQVRAGLRLWVEEDTALLDAPFDPEPCESCRRTSSRRTCHHVDRPVGRPAAPKAPPQGGTFNPHKRGEHNT